MTYGNKEKLKLIARLDTLTRRTVDDLTNIANEFDYPPNQMLEDMAHALLIISGKESIDEKGMIS